MDITTHRPYKLCMYYFTSASLHQSLWELYISSISNKLEMPMYTVWPYNWFTTSSTFILPVGPRTPGKPWAPGDPGAPSKPLAPAGPAGPGGPNPTTQNITHGIKM